MTATAKSPSLPRPQEDGGPQAVTSAVPASGTMTLSRLLRIIRELPDVVFECRRGADGNIYWMFNEGKLASDFHLTTAEVQGRPLQDLFPPDVAGRLRPEFEAAFDGQERDFVNELGGRYFKHHPIPLRDGDGKVEAVAGFISDVTELVKAERRIVELQEASRRLNDDLTLRVLELAKANHELETFSYTVSHDLRTPLTIIENYAQVLAAAGSDVSQADARKALAGLQRAVSRMALLIENILRLSRVSRLEPEWAPMDLVDLAGDVVRELRERQPEPAVRFVAPASLPVTADAQMLRTALANLLGNAWKFSRNARDPRVELGMVPGRSPPVYFVRDNGVGFDPADQPRLFRLFERLHPTAEFEGTGIGLATVRRAIERLGGRVWAEGAPAAGATFYFTLGQPPKAPGTPRPAREATPEAAG